MLPNLTRVFHLVTIAINQTLVQVSHHNILIVAHAEGVTLEVQSTLEQPILITQIKMLVHNDVINYQTLNRGLDAFNLPLFGN
jgi:hypothetical protein